MSSNELSCIGTIDDRHRAGIGFCGRVDAGCHKGTSCFYVETASNKGELLVAFRVAIVAYPACADHYEMSTTCSSFDDGHRPPSPEV